MFVAANLTCFQLALNRIIYRDIKPDNIGFDVRNDVKLFDFGLARELHLRNADSNGTYKLTGDTGSPRYMAPEVALGEPYNTTADVYSFSILVWQLLVMSTPFEHCTSLKQLHTKVYLNNERPSLAGKTHWPMEVIDELRVSWSRDLQKRPSMQHWCSVLRDEIEKNTNDDVSEVLDASRRSAMSAAAG